MRTLNVGLGSRSYPIVIGPGALDGAGAAEPLAAALDGRRYFLVSNTVVAPLYRARLEATLANYSRGGTAHLIGDGETHKNLATLDGIWTAMLAARCDRSTVLVALGGGVVGDIAGFAAATYQRGIPFIQVPTTLLSQVDSSVGGKTGINHPLGKNMIGAFWQPKLVLADTDTLSTLPPREFAAGMAEVIKYGLLCDIRFLEWIEANRARLAGRESLALAEAVEWSCRIKAEVVAADEFETAKEGGRALLNLGHTFGHAIETGSGYGTWLHGEAVAAGTMVAAALSARLGWIDAADVMRIRALFEAFHLPVRAPRMPAERWFELMSHDKKVLAGKLRLVLLRRLGEAVTVADVPQSDIRAAIEAVSGD